MTFGSRNPDLDDVIRHALDQGRDVTIKKADGYGYEILVDDVAIGTVTHELFGHKIPDSLEQEVEQKIQELKEVFVSKHEEAIEQSESTPWFVKQLRKNGLYTHDILEWTDFDSINGVQAALVKAELEQDGGGD